MRFNKIIVGTLRCASSDARSRGWISRTSVLLPKVRRQPNP